MLQYETSNVLSGSLLPLSLTPAPRTTILLYYERGGFDVVLRVPISTLLWQQRRTQACDWLSLADGKAAHWLAVAVWACCSFALAATGDSALTVWVCLLEERRGENTTGGAYTLFLSAHYGFMWWLNIIQQTIMLTFIVQ